MAPERQRYVEYRGAAAPSIAPKEQNLTSPGCEPRVPWSGQTKSRRAGRPATSQSNSWLRGVREDRSERAELYLSIDS